MTKAALERACKIAGGQKALAIRIGTVQQNIWQWLNRAKRGVPAEWCRPIEAATGVPAHELRPDLFSPPSRRSRRRPRPEMEAA